MQSRWVGRGLAAGGVAALGGLALVWAFPVYFRADDALHLEWASGHPNPLAAFMPGQASLLGVFRPLQNLAWWSMFRIFGLRPEPYQLLVTLLFLACLGLLVRLGRRLFSSGAGWCSLAAFLVFFPYLVSVVFWFSDLSFLLESALMLGAINLLVEAFAGRVGFGWAGLAYVLAVLAKEPAAFIVPAASGALLLADWGRLDLRLRMRGLATVATLLAVGAAAAVLHPSLHGRRGALLVGGWGGLAAFVGERWQAYSSHLISGVGAGLVALALLGVWLHLRPRHGPRSLTIWIPAVAAAGAAVLLRGVPSIATAVMVGALLAQVGLRRREGVGAVWFAVPLVGLLTIDFVVRTYLFEAAFGLALVAGATLVGLLSEVWADRRRMPKALVLVLTLALGLAAAVATPRLADHLRTRLTALELVSAARLNFRDMVAALLAPACPPDAIVVVDYGDMGLDYTRDILPLPDIEKARRQKTMMTHELAAFLGVAGGHPREVMTLSAFMRLPPGTRALLVVMNSTEDALVHTLLLQQRVLVERVRRGELARVYGAVR